MSEPKIYTNPQEFFMDFVNNLAVCVEIPADATYEEYQEMIAAGVEASIGRAESITP